MSLTLSMTDENRPPPDWAGDVSLGVKAWVGETPSTPADPATPPPTERRGKKARRTRSHEVLRRARRGEGRRARRRPPPRCRPTPRVWPARSCSTPLTGQARTRKELADKLAKREVPDEVATELLDRFTEVGLIDDSAYARQWVESRHRSRGLAPRALAQELRRKGVGDEEAKEALEQIDEDDQRAAARALVDKKMRSMSGLDRQVATRRLAGMLARKGYSAGLAFSVVREALGEQDERADDEPHPDF